MDQPDSAPRSFRRDGWTAKRQLTFLSELARTRSVTKAARAAGMSREGAYRLRKRDPHGLFAAAWDRVLKVHKSASPRAARKRRRWPGLGGFPAMSIKGHKLHDLLFSCPPSVTFVTRLAARPVGSRNDRSDFLR